MDHHKHSRDVVSFLIVIIVNVDETASLDTLKLKVIAQLLKPLNLLN